MAWVPREALDAADNLRKKALSQLALGSCRMMKYRACQISRPPALNSRGWRLVSDQISMAADKTSRFSRLSRL
jgi:hypothetical protein